MMLWLGEEDEKGLKRGHAEEAESGICGGGQPRDEPGGPFAKGVPDRRGLRDVSGDAGGGLRADGVEGACVGMDCRRDEGLGHCGGRSGRAADERSGEVCPGLAGPAGHRHENPPGSRRGWEWAPPPVLPHISTGWREPGRENGEMTSGTQLEIWTDPFPKGSLDE